MVSTLPAPSLVTPLDRVAASTRQDGLRSQAVATRMRRPRPPRTTGVT
jgi:hypothetical protein